MMWFARPTCIIQRSFSFLYSAHRLRHLLVSPALLGDLYCFINITTNYFNNSSYVVPSSSFIAFSCCTCICWIPRSIFTRHSLVIGTPFNSNNRTSSVCPTPFARRISLIFFPIFPSLFCFILCSNPLPLCEPNLVRI